MITNKGLNIDMNSADGVILFVDTDKECLFLRYFEKATMLKIMLSIDGIAPRRVNMNVYIEYPY